LENGTNLKLLKMIKKSESNVWAQKKNVPSMHIVVICK